MEVPKRLQRWMHWRTMVGLLAALVLIAAVWNDWVSPGDRTAENPPYSSHPASWLALHTMTANVVYSALVAALAWVFFDHRAARRDEAIADSTTSIGLAGTVQPLLGVAFALAWLGERGPVDDRGRSIGDLRTEHSSSSPLKWTRAPVYSECWPDSVPARALDNRDADVVGECIREVVGTVRDWANLFVASAVGREAAFCMQSLRVRLQELQRCIEDGEVDKAHEWLDGVRAQTVHMAVYFEDASGSLQPRKEIERLLARAWAQDDLRTETRLIGQADPPPGVDQPTRTSQGRRMIQALFEHLRTQG